MPAKVLKPLEAAPKTNAAKNRQSSVGAPSKSDEATGRRGMGIAAS